MRAVVALSLLIPSLSFAQEDLDDPQRDLEYKAVDVEDEQEKRLQAKGSLETQWHEFDNIDMRERDESSDQAILDSDDRGAFAFTGISLDLAVKVDDHTRIVGGVSHRGLWGNDQIGNTNVFGGWLYFTALYAEYKFDSGLKFTVGRMFYEPGGIGGSREYIFSDIVDQVRVDIPLGNIGSLIVIPINMVGSAQDPSDVTLVQYIGQSDTQVFGFRGDTSTRRHGLQLKLDGISEALEINAYGFYTDIGALGSGSDISYNGRLGNFTDNDWVINAGVRAQVNAGPITPFVGFDMSSGIDRKELVANDVNADGISGTLGLMVDTSDPEDETKKGFFAEASTFYAQGPSFQDNGMQFSHGYVGMKGRHMGGTLTNRYLGMHPSAYVGMFGVSDSQHDYDRKSGALVVHANAGADVGIFRFRLSYWYMQDTGLVGEGLDFDNLSAVNPPFGYSREEFAAHERLGLTIGQEINIDLQLDITPAIAVRVNGATFLPGEFYAIDIGRVAGEALGGQTAAWGFNAGTRVRF